MTKIKNYRREIIPAIPVSEIGLTYIRKEVNKPKVISSSVGSELLWPFFSKECDLKEMFYLATLNKRNQVIGVFKLSEGTKSSTVVDLSHICAACFLTNASSAIVAHNHPSGEVSPSSQDRDLTNKIKGALSNIDINLIDHLIFGSRGQSFHYLSFADEGYL